MPFISKMITSAAQFSLEVAPALANFNFDFALYKVESPKEFEGVGSALSHIRREEAETGMHHVTARNSAPCLMDYFHQLQILLEHMANEPPRYLDALP